MLHHPGKPAGCQDSTGWHSLEWIEHLALTLWAAVSPLSLPLWSGTQPAPLGQACAKRGWQKGVFCQPDSATSRHWKLSSTILPGGKKTEKQRDLNDRQWRPKAGRGREIRKEEERNLKDKRWWGVRSTPKGRDSPGPWERVKSWVALGDENKGRLGAELWAG